MDSDALSAAPTTLAVLSIVVRRCGFGLSAEDRKNLRQVNKHLKNEVDKHVVSLKIDGSLTSFEDLFPGRRQSIPQPVAETVAPTAESDTGAIGTTAKNHGYSLLSRISSLVIDLYSFRCDGGEHSIDPYLPSLQKIVASCSPSLRSFKLGHDSEHSFDGLVGMSDFEIEEVLLTVFDSSLTFPALQDLAIANAHGCLTAISPVLSTMTALRSLKLETFYGLDLNDIKTLSSAPFIKNLTCLHLSFDAPDDDDNDNGGGGGGNDDKGDGDEENAISLQVRIEAMRILLSNKTIPRVEELSIANVPPSAPELVSLLPTLPHLKHLKLWNFNASLEYIATLSQLESLAVECTFTSPRHFHHLLTSLTSLTSLSFESCGSVSDDPVVVVGTSTNQFLPSMETSTTSPQQEQDENGDEDENDSWSAVFGALHLPCLEEIRFIRNEFSEIDVFHCATAHLPRLQKFIHQSMLTAVPTGGGGETVTAPPPK